MPAKVDRSTLYDLRRLYLEERMTTRQLAEHYGVSSMAVKRWLHEFDIPRRPANNGLIGRGVTPPTEAELRRMVHDEHLSYRAIGEVFGVDQTAIPYWLKKMGIPRPAIWATRRKGRVVTVPPADELRRRYEAGESMHSIGKSIGASRETVNAAFKKHGIEKSPDGWQAGRRWSCTDGHSVRSSYEQRVDDWLYAHSLAHESETPLPFDQRFKSDFLVNGTYIEVWGVVGSASYDERRARKTRLYNEHGLRLIELPAWCFARRTWKDRLSQLL